MRYNCIERGIVMYLNRMGEIIAKKRKEAGMTQAELAMYIGVSKPAVSKWESGYSLPDISLLPVLASFFDISIDELMGYQPQINEKNMDAIYEKLIKSLSELSADTVFNECRSYIGKYYFCWQLILKMSQFMYDHYTLSSDPQEILKEIIGYTKRIYHQCDNHKITRAAKYLNACCLINLNKFYESQTILEDINESVTNASVLLAFIYNEQGRKNDAKKIISDFIEQNLQLIFSAIPSTCIYANETDSELCIEKYSALLEIFEAEKNYPDHLLRFYYAMSIMYCNEKNKIMALEYLCKFISLLEKTIYCQRKSPLVKKQFSNKMILETAINFTVENKAFSILNDEEQYHEIMNKLKKLLEEYDG